MRSVVVLAEAAEDIEKARDFYDEQQPGIGDYCADSLVADIESLALYHASIHGNSDFTGYCRTGFRLEFITTQLKRKHRL